jgi:hypothetical protein
MFVRTAALKFLVLWSEGQEMGDWVDDWVVDWRWFCEA